MEKVAGAASSQIKDTIRVLHIFPPSLKSRFGGQNITWKYNFTNWDDPGVVHTVLDTMTNQILDAQQAFDFKYVDTQKMSTKWERVLWIFALFWGVIRHQKEYDLLHVHVLWWGGLLIGPWAKWKNCPTIYESVLLEADIPSSIIREKFGKIKLGFLKSYKAILAISDYLAQDYLKHGFFEGQVVTLMNSVDTVLFTPAETDEEKYILRKRNKLPVRSKLLLFVGSVIERKGVDILLRALIEACRVDSDLHLLIVGAKNKNENPSLDEDFVNHLYEMLEQNEISDRVSFLGLVQDRERLAEIYRAADIFIFPSRNEGLGNVVLEAMAAGLPVVTSHLPVLERVIQNGENGIFVPIGDAPALVYSILQVSIDLDMAKKMGTAARNYVLEKHRFSAWQFDLVRIYKALLNTSP